MNMSYIKKFTLPKRLMWLGKHTNVNMTIDKVECA